MKAINNYIVIKKIKEEPKSEGGFILSEAQNEDVRYSKGKVVSKGELVNSVNENDIVWYDKHAGRGIEFDGEYLFIIKHSDVVIVQ